MTDPGNSEKNKCLKHYTDYIYIYKIQITKIKNKKILKEGKEKISYL